MKPQSLLRRYLKFTILFLLAALLLFWFARGLDWADVAEKFRQSDRRLLAAGLLVVCLTYVIRAWRWRALLAPLAATSWRELFAATTVGFGALFLVGRAGEVLRPAFLPLRDARVRPSASFVTIGVERIYDMVTVVLLFAVDLLWFRAPGLSAETYRRTRLIGFVLFCGAVVGIVGLIFFKRRAHSFISWLEAKLVRAPSLMQRAGRLLVDLLEQVARALSVLVDARALAITIGWTALLWSAIVLANWLVLRAFALPFGASETVFVLGWALVGSLVPTPGGGAGAFHLATATGLVFLGVAETQAKSVSIFLHLVLFGPALFFGLYYFLRSDVSLARLRSLAAAEAREPDLASIEQTDFTIDAKRTLPT